MQWRRFRDAIVEQVAELPLGVNLVATQRDLIESVIRGDWWTSTDDLKQRDLIARLGPLMRFRQQRRGAMVSLDLADLTAVRERITVGADGRDMPIATYRQRVEEAVRTLAANNPVLQRIQGGVAVSDIDLRSLANLLEQLDPTIDEERLRKAYDVRRATFLQLIRHVLGLQSLESWSTAVTREFDRFIAEHSTWSALQIRFLQTLRTYVLQRGKVERRDPRRFAVHAAPSHQGVRGVFAAGQIEEILAFTGELPLS